MHRGELVRRRSALALALLLVGGGDTASAKLLLCPPGSFEMRATDGPAPIDGAVLRLADVALAEIEGMCGAATAKGAVFRNGWGPRFRVRWTGCDTVMGLRARFRDECRELGGVVRTRSGRRRFSALRLPVCGDRIAQTGEDCDDGNGAAGDCCVGCRAEPGCHVPCERTADCAPYAVCARYDDTCTATTGVCRLPIGDECVPDAVFPICGCDGNPYGSECAAWEAGIAVQGGDGLNQPVGNRCRCGGRSGLTCSGERFCEMPYRCRRPESRLSRLGGICVDVPDACIAIFGPPVCGCDGRTYATSCERSAARVQEQCVCEDVPPLGPRCGLDTMGQCDCSRGAG
jgi:cysteine-rich repeat protein